MTLTDEQLKNALAAIAAWRINPHTSCACPVCRHAGLSIIDRSARPHAEWFVLSCTGCGLSTTLHIPMSGVPES